MDGTYERDGYLYVRRFAVDGLDGRMSVRFKLGFQSYIDNH